MATITTTEQKRTATQLLSEMFTQYGLSSLVPLLTTLIKEETDDAVVLMRIRQSAEYKDRFPAMAALNSKGIPFNEQNYFDYEIRANQLESQYGLPRGMLTSRDQIKNLLENNVDAQDLTRRMVLNAAASQTAPQETKDALQRLYGIDQGGLTAYYLDPQNSLSTLEQVSAAASIAGVADKQGFTIEREQAERLNAEGFSATQARDAFGTAASLRGLGKSTGQALSDADLTGAAFGDAAALQKVQTEQKRASAAFEGGGSAAASTSGISGLGRASQ
jgi:hypothetical protein